jgi:hypothetical protein
VAADPEVKDSPHVRSAFAKLKIILLEPAAFAGDLHRSSLMKNIYPVGMYLSARNYGDCGEHDERR